MLRIMVTLISNDKTPLDANIESFEVVITLRVKHISEAIEISSKLYPTLEITEVLSLELD